MSENVFKEGGGDSAKNKLVLLSPMGMSRIRDTNCGKEEEGGPGVEPSR